MPCRPTTPAPHVTIRWELEPVVYTGDHQRWKQVATFFDGSAQTTEYIGGLFNKITNSNGTAYEYYIPSGNTTVEYTRWSTGETFLNYVTTDHLGSSALITDSTGAPVVTESFGALGYRRSSTTWAGPPSDAEWQGIDSTTTRGFTGQEMVDHLGVVNMNGRIYMETGEFASPDPFIFDPANTQSYNRYSYVLNNPLKYVDPSGFDCWIPLPQGTGGETAAGVWEPCGPPAPQPGFSGQWASPQGPNWGVRRWRRWGGRASHI